MKKLLILLFSILISFNSYGETETYYYENGQIKFERNYQNGELVSETKYQYYENGQIEAVKNYKDDKRDGKWTHWDENGLKQEEYNYKDDIVDGIWTKWYKNGQKQEGNLTIWYANGQIQSDGNYIDGKKDGKWINWNQKGQITSEKHMKNGNIISETRYEYHYSNGSKKSVKNFNNNGKKHGKYTSWFKSGQTQLDTNYKDGNEDGKYTLSFEDGRVIERFYIDGECITGDC